MRLRSLSILRSSFELLCRSKMSFTFAMSFWIDINLFKVYGSTEGYKRSIQATNLCISARVSISSSNDGSQIPLGGGCNAEMINAWNGLSAHDFT